MQKSIKDKFFLFFVLLIFIVIGIIIILNTLVLEDYYIYTKKENLINLYSEINKIYSKYDYSSNPEIIESELEKIDSKSNIDIVVQNGREITIYSTSRDFSRNKFLLSNLDIQVSLSNDYFDNKLKNGNKYFTEVIKDNSLNSDFVFLAGKLDNNFNIFIRTSVESIKESILITNKFLIIVGFISIVVSGITAMIIAKTLTKPIQELNTISQKMSKLDFSQKYEVESDDEIGMLGISINTLSSNLEKTIQQLKNANLELEKDIEETSKLSEMRNQFISDVSHELKTPIALIQGYAEGLADGIIKDEESRKFYYDVILDESNKMAELTRGLLDLSNLEYGKNELNIQVFNITELINTLIKKHEVILKEKNITAEFNYTDELNVKADTFRIEQVLTNYFNNAINHLDDKRFIKISIDDTLEKNLIKVSIFNSGNHIEEENLNKVWNRFYKIDSSRNREIGGSGIGLSLVKAIMKQHHMKYGVENVKDGVSFWFELEKE